MRESVLLKLKIDENIIHHHHEATNLRNSESKQKLVQRGEGGDLSMDPATYLSDIYFVECGRKTNEKEHGRSCRSSHTLPTLLF